MRRLNAIFVAYYATNNLHTRTKKLAKFQMECGSANSCFEQSKESSRIIDRQNGGIRHKFKE